MSDIAVLIRSVDALARGDAVLRAKLEVLATVMVSMIDGCDSVSVAIVIEGRTTTAAISDRVALEVDLMQYRSDEGPCLDALSGRVVRLDVVEDGTYARFAPGALDAGVADILSIPCLADGRVVATVNIYSRTRHGLAAAEQAAAPIIRVVTQTITSSGLLEAALELADEAASAVEEQMLVNRAVGLVAHRRTCSMEAALAVIVETAMTEGQSLRAAAEAILEGHAETSSEE